MEFTGSTLTVWTMRSLWLALAISIGSAFVFAGIFLTGYIVQNLWPRSRYAKYFNETDLFALWMVSMLCGLGLAMLLFLLGVKRFTSENPFFTGLFATLSFAAIASPIVTVGAIGKTHTHVRKKRAQRNASSTPAQATSHTRTKSTKKPTTKASRRKK